MAASLRRNAFWQLLLAVMGTGTELVILLVLAANRSVAEFGAIALALSGSKVVFLACEPRIHEFLTPKLARYLGRTGRAVWSWTRLARRVEFSLNLFALFLCFLGATLLPLVSQTISPELFVACAVYTWANTLLKFSSLSIFRCLGEMHIPAAHALLGGGIKLSLLVAFLHSQIAAEALMGLLAVPALVVAAAQSMFAHRHLAMRTGSPPPAVRGRLRTGNRRKQLRLAFSNYATGLVEIGHREVDTQITGWLAGSAEAGRYRLAKTFAMCLLEALNPLVLVLLPELSRRLAKRDGQATAAFVRRISLGLAGIAFVAGLLVLGAAAVYLTLFAPMFWSIWTTLVLLLGGFMLIAPSLWAQAYLVAAGRPDVYLRASLLGAGIGIGLAWLTVGQWGATGSAFAHCVGLAVTNGLALWAAWRHVDELPIRRESA